MADRLVSLLQHFTLQARVFHLGPMCRNAKYDARNGLGYIHVLRDGALKLETAGQPQCVLEVPSLIFYMNPTTHRMLPSRRSADLVCASFEFGVGVGNPIGQALPSPQIVRLADAPTLDMALGLLFKEASEEHCGKQVVLDRMMEVVIVQLLRDLMDQNRVDVGLIAGLANPKLMKALNAMHAEVARDWSLEDLASVAGMSRARFAAKFRETVGVTPGAYLSRWRLGVAQSLLRRGKSVQLIADEVGYGSSSALSRAFSAHVGVSPTEWLKRGAAG